MTPTEGLTMSYEGLVAAGREARVQADNMQWVEGDLALQVEALPADEYPRDPETGTFIADEVKALKRYAEDIDVPHKTVKEYRRVAQAWPVATRVATVGWKAHQILAAQEDRFELVRDRMTGREAQKLVQDRTKGNSGKPGWHELLGRVGEALKTAEKHMGAVEAAITREPGEKLQSKASEYAEWADDLAQRLRALVEIDVPAQQS